MQPERFHLSRASFLAQKKEPLSSWSKGSLLKCTKSNKIPLFALTTPVEKSIIDKELS